MSRDDLLLSALAGIVGPAHVLTGAADLAPYLTDWRGRYRGAAQLRRAPASTAEVAAVVAACAGAGAAVVPQGGNTSLCGGATPDGEGGAVIVSLARAEPHRRGRPQQQHDDGRGRLRAGGGAGSGARRRAAVPAVAGGRGQLPDRRQPVDQRRRRPGAALRQHARTDARPRSGAARRATSGTACAACARTTPATTSSSCSSAPRARSASSPPRC